MCPTPITISHKEIVWPLRFLSSERLLRRVAAVDEEIAARHERRGVRDQEDDGPLVLILGGHAAHGDEAAEPFHEPLIVVVVNPAGREGINPDVIFGPIGG